MTTEEKAEILRRAAEGGAFDALRHDWYKAEGDDADAEVVGRVFDAVEGIIGIVPSVREAVRLIYAAIYYKMPDNLSEGGALWQILALGVHRRGLVATVDWEPSS